MKATEETTNNNNNGSELSKSYLADYTDCFVGRYANSSVVLYDFDCSPL